MGHTLKVQRNLRVGFLHECGISKPMFSTNWWPPKDMSSIIVGSQTWRLQCNRNLPGFWSLLLGRIDCKCIGIWWLGAVGSASSCVFLLTPPYTAMSLNSQQLMKIVWPMICHHLSLTINKLYRYAWIGDELQQIWIRKVQVNT